MTDNMNDDDAMPEALGLLLSALSGKCEHEVSLMRMTTVLGLLVLRHGGKVELDLSTVEALKGKAVAIRTEGDRMTVEVTEARPERAMPEPTHDAPQTRQ